MTTELECNIVNILDNPTGLEACDFYNNYDYESFWDKRQYENMADSFAVRRLISLIEKSSPHSNIIDIGGGIGRHTPLYSSRWHHSVILDSSSTQLNVAKKNIPHTHSVDFVNGSMNKLPFLSESFDTALCVRAFHYIEDPRLVIKDIKRVLVPGGYFILEIPNKIHAKAKIKSFFSRNSISSGDSVSRSILNQDILFLNHHPRVIQDILSAEDFDILDILSVSNFRNSFFKKVFTIKTLLFFEKMLQRPLAKVWFGPSIYFLAQKTNREPSTTKTSK